MTTFTLEPRSAPDLAAARRLSFAAKAQPYLELGWPVFPLHSVVFGAGWPQDPAAVRCTCGDRDCARAGKHPRVPKRLGGQGWKEATTMTDQIESWDHEYPDANIALPTGSLSGLVVIDLDGERGLASLDYLAGLRRRLPETASVRTGNGRHLYYRVIGGLRNSVKRLAPGIDIRGEGGQAVLPPSVHGSGAVYRWETSPLVLKPRLLPDWVPVELDKLRQRRQEEQYRGHVQAARKAKGRPPFERIEGFAREVSLLPQNCERRNHTLNRNAFIGFRIARDSEGEVSDGRVFDQFMAAAQACGLSAGEARATILSAKRGAYAQP